MSTKVVTGKVRFSFCNIFEARESQGGGDPKYSVTLLIPKSDTATLGKIKTAIADGFKPEIDVRGLTGDEAWWRIDKYIDDAYLAGVSSVRIIHGKGTGALRAALWGFFRADKRIASFRAGVYGEGDAGVSILELK